MSTEKKTKKELPQILEVDCEDKEKIALLLEKTLALKVQIGVEPDEKKGVEGSGLLKQYDDAKVELAVLQKYHNLEGMRHNNIAFMTSHRDGRETLIVDALMEGMVKAGLEPTQVKRIIEDATKVGAGYWVKEIVDLSIPKKPRSKKGEWD